MNKQTFAIIKNRYLYEYMTDIYGRESFSCSIGPSWNRCVYVDVANILDFSLDISLEAKDVLEEALSEGIYHLLAIDY